LASNPNMLNQSVEITDLLYRVSALCYIKNQILESLDCENDYKWREMTLFLLHNIQSHLKLLNCFVNLAENSCDITHKQSFLDITCELIWHTLEHSYSMIHYHKERKRLYLKLYNALTGNERYPSYYLGEAMRRYPKNLNSVTVIAFINFFVKTSGESSQNEVKQMLSLKNSMTIVKHFNKGLSRYYKGK